MIRGIIVGVVSCLLSAPLSASAPDAARGASAATPYNLPDKPGPHTVNALLYAQRADQFRQEAAGHHAMKQLYAGDAEMSAHCDRLIEHLTALAREYQAVADLHEKKAEAGREPLLRELRKRGAAP